MQVKYDVFLSTVREKDGESGGGGESDNHITSPTTDYKTQGNPPHWVVSGLSDGEHRACWMAFDGVLNCESSNCDSGHCWLPASDGHWVQAVKDSDFAVKTIKTHWLCKSGSRKPDKCTIAATYDGTTWVTIISNAEWAFDHTASTEFCTGTITLGNTPLIVRGLRITANGTHGYNSITWYDC